MQANDPYYNLPSNIQNTMSILNRSYDNNNSPEDS